ncbi:UDP-3-O-(3-hydroxymyristoyl)glucosamine N-acyltransferase [Rhizobium sp. YJ-22]|uniref:UDP-3-O-(3-hydroxymyristoyl)glucosamine N-acyltransferase n=1 Tax=Rhizobium sp. YJ-22 TaxID=3037556 RepID=UPI0024124ECF|nr:UDP-3-O-(3-hydroxymyristoyl)glucosamine N-acyltransferase [Rhizobium sp. YJ-22]MDG3578507.1 UDP-3-O-(3-hydroxymyristoyl)glucosamine N-acyltransferase [Rhizobium sp. YJ-22]
MEHNRFFPPHDGIALGALAEKIGAELVDKEWANRPIRSVAPISRAGEGDICYILSRRSKAELQSCAASAILCDKALQSAIPSHIPVLLTSAPNTAFARAGALLHPQAMLPQPIVVSSGISPAAFVDPSAHIEDGVTIEPMAVIGADAAIGAGSHIGPGAIIGPHVKIGRNCVIAGGASILCAYLGNDVIIHNGARIGQDGFGYAPGPGGMLKIVQVGRVIIQDKVEIGANTTIDRGAMDDTVIGEGTKIDNLVQVGHNVRIGRHCGIVAKVGIAGSTRIGDGVMIGGAAAINGHIHIGDGAQIAALSGVVGDVPPGERYGGIPARPMRDFLRDMAEVAARSGSRAKKTEKDND